MNHQRLIILSFFVTFIVGLFVGILITRYNLIPFRLMKFRESHQFRGGGMRGESAMLRLPGIDPEILDELDLTKEQRQKIESIISESRKGMRQELISVHTQMVQSGKEVSEEITKILKPEQQQKYREILEKETLYLPPPIFIFDVEELNLSDVQREKIEEIMEGRAQHFKVGYRDIRKHISGPMRDLRARIDSVLTPDQQKKLRELTSPRERRREMVEPEPVK